MKIHVSQLTPEQLPHALMLAMKRKTPPEINWELAGKIIEKEKRISLVARYEKYLALYIGLKSKLKNLGMKLILSDQNIQKLWFSYMIRKNLFIFWQKYSNKRKMLNLSDEIERFYCRTF